MEENKKIKKVRNDVIFIAALLLIFIAIGVVLLLVKNPEFFDKEKKEGKSVSVMVDGELYGTYSLDVNQTIKIETKHGYNILIIENGSAYVGEASCPDGICSDHQPINLVNEEIICLPNKVVISVSGNSSGETDDDPGLDIVS